MAEEAWRRDLTLAIGRITIASSSLEFRLSGFYATLIGGPGAEIIAFGPGWKSVYDGCQAILKQAGQSKFRDQCADVLTEANRLYGLRHEVVHGFWVGHDERDTFTVRMKYFGKRSVEQWTLKRLETLGDDLWRVAAQISELDERVESSGALKLGSTESKDDPE